MLNVRVLVICRPWMMSSSVQTSPDEDDLLPGETERNLIGVLGHLVLSQLLLGFKFTSTKAALVTIPRQNALTNVHLMHCLGCFNKQKSSR